jgi:hypothetical protein
MAVVTVKSLSITNLDASPIIAMPTGEGAEGILRVANDFVTATVGDSIGSVYRCCRIPTNAKVKRVLLTYPTASTAGATDIDVAFSDSLTDGTQAAFSALTNPVVQISGPVDNKLFGSGTVLTAALKNSDITFGNTFTPQHQNLPLWQVLVNLGCTQFTADPGGFFDLVAKLTVALTVAAGAFSLECDYVE